MSDQINIEVTNNTSPISVELTSSSNSITVDGNNSIEVGITANSSPVFVNVSEVGIQGAPGIDGSGVSTSAGGGAGVSGINNLSGILYISGAGNITVLNSGTNTIYVSGNFISTGDSDLRYYPLNSNPSGYLVALESALYTIGVNKTNSTLTKGNAVYVSGTQGNRPKIWPAIATSGNQTNSHRIIGLVESDILNNGTGYVRIAGVLQGINTSSYGDGDILYLSSGTLGGITNTPSSDPKVENIKIGYSLNSTPNGSILIDLEVPENIEDLHQIYLSSPQNDDYIVYNSNSGVWINRNLNTGQFYPSSNPQEYITSGNVSSNYATINNLQSTGSNLYNLIINESGVFQNSGISLDQKINSLSGYSNNNFATITNLQTTGQNFYSYLTNLSGTFDITGSNLSSRILTQENLSKVTGISITGSNSTTGLIYISGANIIYPILNNNTIIISGDTSSLASQSLLNTTNSNLQTTGQNLYSYLTNLSGVFNTTGSNLQSQITGKLDYSGIILFDTETGILLRTGQNNYSLAMSTDTFRLFLPSGTGWFVGSEYYRQDGYLPDLGYVQSSNRLGYGNDYITDKVLSNCVVGNYSLITGTGVTIPTGALQCGGTGLSIFYQGKWNPVTAGITLYETSGILQTVPFGYVSVINVYNGNSDLLGLNRLPLIQGYKASQGAYPIPLKIDGGSF